MKIFIDPKKIFINPQNGHKMFYFEGKLYYLINGKPYYRVTLKDLLNSNL